MGPGTLYGAITRLEERGLIRPIPSEDRRQPYALTADGRRQLQDQAAAMRNVAATALDRLSEA